MSRPGNDHSAAKARKPWYAEGLRFECRPDCGRCCTNHGDWAWVYLEEADAARLAEHFRLDLTEFLARYTIVDEGHLALRMDGPACGFLDGTRCTVYEARPTQCRTFPFWRENVRSRHSWDSLRTFCPGVGEGPVHNLVQIRSSLTAGKAD